MARDALAVVLCQTVGVKPRLLPRPVPPRRRRGRRRRRRRRQLQRRRVRRRVRRRHRRRRRRRRGRAADAAGPPVRAVRASKRGRRVRIGSRRLCVVTILRMTMETRRLGAVAVGVQRCPGRRRGRGCWFCSKQRPRPLLRSSIVWVRWVAWSRRPVPAATTAAAAAAAAATSARRREWSRRRRRRRRGRPRAAGRRRRGRPNRRGPSGSQRRRRRWPPRGRPPGPAGRRGVAAALAVVLGQRISTVY